MTKSAVKTNPTLDDWQEAVIWMSGSGDFAPGGKARRGFLKIVKPLLDSLSTEGGDR